MSTLKLSLLGPPTIDLDGRPIDIRPRKALALLIYLACKGRRQPRDRLATLLWPESGQRQARGALRRRLSELDQALGGMWLETDRENVALVVNRGLWVDVSEFEKLVAECRTHGHEAANVCERCLEPLTAAVALCQDDFLTGFTLPDCAEYDDWQLFYGEELRLTLAAILERLVTRSSGLASASVRGEAVDEGSCLNIVATPAISLATPPTRASAASCNSCSRSLRLE